MKHYITTFVLFGLLAATPVFGQKTNLLIFKKLYETQQAPINKTTPQKNTTDRGGEELLRASRCDYWDDDQINYYNDSTIYSYDTEGRLIDLNITFFDGNSWLPDSRYIIDQYDADGNKLHQILQLWNGVDLESYSQYYYTYNSNNQIVLQIEEQWDGNAWGNSDTSFWQYNASGNPILIFTPYSHSFYEYDANGNKSVVTIQVKSANGLENRDRFIYTYNAQNLITTQLTQAWTNQSTWIDTYLTSNSYDSIENQTTLLQQEWDGLLWQNKYYRTYEYDNARNEISFLTKEWKNNSWENLSQYFAAFNANNNQTSITLNHWNANDWIKNLFCVYYYTDFVSTHSPTLVVFDLFPNPATTSVTLKGKGLTRANIFDQAGRLLRSQGLSGQAEETLQVGHLPAGNYFLQVVGKDGNVGAKPFQTRN